MCPMELLESTLDHMAIWEEEGAEEKWQRGQEQEQEQEQEREQGQGD